MVQTMLKRRRPIAYLLVASALYLGLTAFVPSSAPRVAPRTAETSRLTVRGTQVEVLEDKKEEPEDAFAKFIDRWSTNGGLLLGSVIFIGLGIGLEKFLELFLDWTKAGMAITFIYSAGLIIWLSQYLWRVENKQTTYAQQLTRYEQEVMIRRLSELTDDEIEALCAECGIETSDVDSALVGDDKIKALSQKEKILELFKTTEMKSSLDPRAGMPFFS
eukprot:CAMPEP_0181435762 /NCGR_PEP_ID=MMETSP1110-20121109/20501_1 /TAXON_ID=174948 /ORGANISM="Symbiodinium sp., Strain CCMP421" /LENGTH=217 /DNA_ID=CAMNT_0023559309 /DNA_START=75 /DNA_END=728 /DNA_ORIENTATION=-